VVDQLHEPDQPVLPLNWLPTLIRDAGYSTSMAVLIGTSLQVGGVIGTLTLGRFINRFGFTRVLGLLPAGLRVHCVDRQGGGHAGAAVRGGDRGGFCIVGGQPAVNALAGTFYPTTLRSTGIGWALGIGRIGSVVGPVIGGQLIALQWSNGSLFIAAAVPALISALTIARLHRTSRGVSA
jgi:AAHS family 4-hydroxybenzoate transporter-like MFS transporter